MESIVEKIVKELENEFKANMKRLHGKCHKCLVQIEPMMLQDSEGNPSEAYGFYCHPCLREENRITNILNRRVTLWNIFKETDRAIDNLTKGYQESLETNA